MTRFCARLICGHEWDDHNHVNPDPEPVLADEDCCTVRGCDCEIFLPDDQVGKPG